MLPKNRRIPRAEFPHILALGRRYNSSHLLLYVSFINKQTPSRFSFSISKKIQKFAVKRNLYRRRGYSVIQPIISHVAPGYFLFFSFKKGSYPLLFAELEKEIVGLLTSVGVLS